MGCIRLASKSALTLFDSGEITAQALARSSSAAARKVRKAVPPATLLAYCVLMACSVRSAWMLETRLTSSIDAAITISGVPSRDPPSALMITALSRGKPIRIPVCIACTTEPDGFGIVVSRQADEYVDLAHIYQLAKEIIREKAVLRQLDLCLSRGRPCANASCGVVSMLTAVQIRRKRNQ